MERQPITQEKYDEKLALIKELEAKESDIADRIKEAREEGDLKENAEYHGQREAQGQVMARISLIKTQLANTYIVDKSKITNDAVNVGTVVTVKDLSDGMEEKYEFVGLGEEDYDGDIMKILTTSPIAQSLMGKKIGDQVEAEIPRGTLKMEVVAIDLAD